MATAETMTKQWHDGASDDNNNDATRQHDIDDKGDGTMETVASMTMWR